jgi:hypothetical protein
MDERLRALHMRWFRLGLQAITEASTFLRRREQTHFWPTRQNQAGTIEESSIRRETVENGELSLAKS